MGKFILALLRRVLPEREMKAIEEAPIAFLVSVLVVVSIVMGTLWRFVGASTGRPSTPSTLIKQRDRGIVANRDVNIYGDPNSAVPVARELTNEQREHAASALARLPAKRVFIKRDQGEECAEFAKSIAATLVAAGWPPPGIGIYSPGALPREGSILIIGPEEPAKLIEAVFRSIKVSADHIEGIVADSDIEIDIGILPLR